MTNPIKLIVILYCLFLAVPLVSCILHFCWVMREFREKERKNNTQAAKREEQKWREEERREHERAFQRVVADFGPKSRRHGSNFSWADEHFEEVQLT